jgi:ethanolamine transporter EutH
MSIPAINSTLIVLATLAIVTFYGAIAGSSRLRSLILSVYVGIVLSNQLTAVVAPFAQGLGSDQVTMILFVLPILLFGFSLGKQHGHDRGALVFRLLLGLLTGGLIVSAGINVLPPSQAQDVINSSFVAMNLNQFHLWLVALLPIFVLVGPLFRKKSRSHH